MKRLIVGLVVLAVADTGQADFVLIDSEYLEVTSKHETGILYDSSSVDVKQGARIDNLYVYNDANLNIFGGLLAGVSSYDTGNVTISGGDINGPLDSYGDSNVTVSGGNISRVTPYETSSVSISGGNIGFVTARGTSTVAVSGGHINGLLEPNDDSSVTIFGGTVARLIPRDDSNVDIFGVRIGDYVGVMRNATLTFHGYDFRAAAGLQLENETVLGDGLLNGKWADGTPWIIDIRYQESGATIQTAIIPEPSALILLLSGAVTLACFRRLRRRAPC